MKQLDALFRPRSVAVVGTSRDRDSLGRKILDNLLAYDFQGVVYPVNPAAEVVHSMKCWPSVESIPDPVDLAVIVVPRRAVAAALEDCARKGVRGAVIITAGFGEVGQEGRHKQAEILELARDAGIRLIGPNCMGIINAEPGVRLDATFAAYLPLAGNVSFISQSGALGEAILAACRRGGIGIHMFASVGNRADISSNDLLEYWEDDEGTGVILLYLESFGNPRRFPAIARRVSRKKPIIAVKAGRTGAGARAAVSHTGALAARDVAIDTLFEQTGILRVRTLEELLRVANAFAAQPLPRGSRVGIVTNAGGPGILATDACVSLGLEVPELHEDTRRELREVLPAEASVINPVDLIATASPDAFREGIRLTAADPNIDALIVIGVSLITTDDTAQARAIVDGLADCELPVLSCFMGKALSTDGADVLRRRGIPVFDFPEAAAQALAAMDRYRRYRDRPEGEVPALEGDLDRARAALQRARDEGRANLDALDLAEVLEAYGIAWAPMRRVDALEDAVGAAKGMGFPVVLKFFPSDVVHKTEAGAVHPGLQDMDDLVEAWEAGRERFPDAPAVVQEHRGEGREVIMGMTQDPSFGPLMMFGLGGTQVEVLGDVVFRIHPLTDVDAREMIEGIRGRRLLEGWRNEPPVDRDHLAETILKLSKLVGDLPELVEIEINPYVVGTSSESSAALDVRGRLA